MSFLLILLDCVFAFEPVLQLWPVCVATQILTGTINASWFYMQPPLPFTLRQYCKLHSFWTFCMAMLLFEVLPLPDKVNYICRDAEVEAQSSHWPFVGTRCSWWSKHPPLTHPTDLLLLTDRGRNAQHSLQASLQYSATGRAPSTRGSSCWRFLTYIKSGIAVEFCTWHILTMVPDLNIAIERLKFFVHAKHLPKHFSDSQSTSFTLHLDPPFPSAPLLCCLMV